MIRSSDEHKWIRLKGISGHGKNRIREHGDLWFVVMVSPDHAPGRAMLRSSNMTFKFKNEMCFDSRWIEMTDDKNFEVVRADL
tara:strand:- start:1618 stop:1866 length:249 start_codon:yes stop_codon:yes gene_type:complete